MDYGKAFTYVFEEDNWITKFVIGAVVTLIPIVNFAGNGYCLQVLRNVRDGDPQPLPEWDDFGGYFMDGLKFVIGVLAYALPVIVLSLLTIPLGIFAGDDPGALFGLGITAVSCLMVLFALLPTVLLPALLVQYTKRSEIRDMFALGEIWEMIRADLGTYIILLIMIFFVLSFIASIGAIACGIGFILTTWYAQLIGAHLTGQYAARLPGAEKAV